MRYEKHDGFEIASLSYGMVKPRFQKTGLGKLLLLARLACLPLDREHWGISIAAVGGSEGFYKKVGFRYAYCDKDDCGTTFDAYLMNVPKMFLERIKEKATEIGISIHEEQPEIPIVVEKGKDGEKLNE